MLVKFRVENYKSFDSEQSLSMIAGISRDHSEHTYDVKGTHILRTAVIFGSNGSGKTNLIKAMMASRNLVILGQPIMKNDYCRMRPDNVKRPTSFEYTVEFEGTQYSYGFEILLSSGMIQSEWLYNITNGGDSKKIFLREGDGIESGVSLSKDDSKYFEVYSMEAKNNRNIPFLSILSKAPSLPDSKLSVVHKLINWFSTKLRIIAAGTAIDYNFDKRLSTFTGRSLPQYGTGISKITYEDVESPNNTLPFGLTWDMLPPISNKGDTIGTIRSPIGIFTVSVDDSGEPVVRKMMFEHKGVNFEYPEESDGTKRLMELLPLINDNDASDLTYVVDEIDRSLHPQLTKKFIKDFEALPQELKRQLIVTAHESRLMDLNLVRRDEIWFVDKNEEGTSRVYSLEAFNERKDKRVDKAYLDGRYGATPCFKTLFPDLE